MRITKAEAEALRILQRNGQTSSEETADYLVALASKAPHLLSITAYTDSALHGRVTAAGEMFLLRYSVYLMSDGCDYQSRIDTDRHWMIMDAGRHLIIADGRSGWYRLQVDLNNYQRGSDPHEDKEAEIAYAPTRKSWQAAYRIARQLANATPGNPARLNPADICATRRVSLGGGLRSYVINEVPPVTIPRLMDREEEA